MANDSMFFQTPAEPLDRKRKRVLGRLLAVDETGAVRARIETQLTGTEADRPVLVTASAITSAFVADEDRLAGARVRVGGREGNRANAEKAAERHAAWLEEALALARGRPGCSISSVAARVAGKHGVPKETARKILAKRFRGRG